MHHRNLRYSKVKYQSQYISKIDLSKLGTLVSVILRLSLVIIGGRCNTANNKSVGGVLAQRNLVIINSKSKCESVTRF